jgi:hypothetical protein
MKNILQRIKIIKYFFKFKDQYEESVKKYHIKYNPFLRLFVFIRWYKSLSSKKNTLDIEQPWIVLFSIPFLKKNVTKKSIVFEYGSGGSTVFFAERADKVISVEHDSSWYEKLSSNIQTKKNIELVLITPSLQNPEVRDPSSGDSYISSADAYNGYSFFKYASYIDKYPDNHFDVILIDGRARPSCLKHAVPKIKKGGYIILDDADREYYLSNTSHFIKEFSKIDFPGPVYGLEPFYRTLILRKN